MSPWFREYSRSPLLIGVTACAGLLFLSWVVSVRLGDAEMPMKDGFAGFGSFGTVAELTEDMGAGGDTSAEAAVGTKLKFLAPNMPPFSDIAAWLQSEPLTPESLAGKVVLVDFWTYSCINCIRTLPYVTAWHKTYEGQGFTVIGVHTPEFAFEEDETNVRKAIARHGITYPVALDNDYGTWNNYSNRYWPAHYLFDAKGRLRYTHFGEGKYDETEEAIRSLLAEARAAESGELAKMPMAAPQGEVTAVDFERIGTRETYLGYARMEGLGSPEPLKRDEPQSYSVVQSPVRNSFYFAGTWKVGEEHSTAVNASAGITFKYTASNANLVMGAPGTPVFARVLLDGADVTAGMRGADIIERDGMTFVEVGERRLYDLIDARGDYGTRVLRIEFERAGAEVYAFTFG